MGERKVRNNKIKSVRKSESLYESPRQWRDVCRYIR